MKDQHPCYLKFMFSLHHLNWITFIHLCISMLSVERLEQVSATPVLMAWAFFQKSSIPLLVEWKKTETGRED